jgi:hypothetical protein
VVLDQVPQVKVAQVVIQCLAQLPVPVVEGADMTSDQLHQLEQQVVLVVVDHKAQQVVQEILHLQHQAKVMLVAVEAAMGQVVAVVALT